ncbi:LacI family DNA-binding transcriptional regulator [Pelagibius sp.]|uniref:LacI family DNA-binding transcriptional regulator n=1 Tax=Pelagibius sp. TaxID=1931238 RepID=UPI00261BB5B9|nr:LacI family DNA-binding transcriptional regulator [Pelagibius sp.]
MSGKMVKETVTSTDVARHAGVSQSAVSRVFTPGASVSTTMRERVMKSAEALGYRPNALARSLISGRSRIIGVVVAYLDNQFYPVALEKLSNALQAQGYHILVFMASQTRGNLDHVLQEILDYQVDGLVMASVAMSSDLAAQCDAAGVPVVLFNRSQDDQRLSAVTSDNLRGGRDVARFLVAGGHRRIAYIAGWEGASTNRDREAGFLKGLEEAGIPLFDRAVGDYDFEHAKQATRQLFDRPAGDRPDAVFVANDHMAIAVLDVLRHVLGIRVPEDVSVVGYDDVPEAAWSSYDLTTVRQPTNRMVDATVRILMDRIEEGQVMPQRIAIGGPLMLRGSARRPDGQEDAEVWP